MTSTTDREKWKAYDLAEWTLDLLISHYSEMISKEKNGESPDLEMIQLWLKEQNKLDDERDALRVEKVDNSIRVIETYSSSVKEFMRHKR